VEISALKDKRERDEEILLNQPLVASTEIPIKVIDVHFLQGCLAFYTLERSKYPINKNNGYNYVFIYSSDINACQEDSVEREELLVRSTQTKN
jgi:hypothetical protein